MSFIKLYLKLKIFLVINIFICFSSSADNHNIYDTLEVIKKDLKTLEKAVYSSSHEFSNSNLSSSEVGENNSEDVLTRHLLKLSEIENQFQELTNKFEEINFKLDKLSSRLSKVQADNQLRFQNLESTLSTGESTNKVTKNKVDNDLETLPGSSKPQDLGSISYKDNSQNDVSEFSHPALASNFLSNPAGVRAEHFQPLNQSNISYHGTFSRK